MPYAPSPTNRCCLLQRTSKWRPASHGIASLLFALAAGCADTDPVSGTAPGASVQPGAVQNADGSFTNPDGSVVSADGTVMTPAAGSAAGTDASGAVPGGTSAPSASGSAPSAGTGSAETPGVDGSAGDPTEDPGSVAAGSDCSGNPVLAPKRIVRLSFNQVANSVRALLGAEFGDDVVATYELPTPTERTFPPLNNPREGSVIIDAQWQTGDAIAQAAGAYAAERVTELAGCADPLTAECARDYAQSFAERAFRRPLSPAERTAHDAVFDGVIALGALPSQALAHSVYASLSAPQFLYRTEFGADAFADGALDAYETASMISYFVTDGPPDAELLQSAADGALLTPEQIGAQVERLLQTPIARENLQAAMFSYFGISTLGTIVIDPEVAPSFTEGLRASMMRETELFINGTLWDGTVTDLLTSQASYVNQGLADLYGIPYPPAGSTPDADGFALATLPDNRSGILTQPGYLTTRSSPEEPSVVRRGLLVNASLLCATNPPFPEAQAEQIDAVIDSLDGMSEREMAEYRAASPECGGCHVLFDAYGLALDNFDVIGAYREVDHEGRTIDASVTLPAPAGGATVTSPRQMATELVSSGAFTRCVSKNLLAYALAEGSTISASSCATKAVTDAFDASDQSFSALVREVAKSVTFTARSKGESQ